MANWMLGVSKHHLGSHGEARYHLLRCIERDDEISRQVQLKRFGYDRRVDSLSVLGNLLWVQGLPDQARRAAARAIGEARSLAHAVPLCVALAWNGFTLSISGCDPAAAESCIGELVELASKHDVESYHGLGLCLMGIALGRRGQVERALKMLSDGLGMLSRSRYEVFHPLLLSEQLRIMAMSGYARGRPRRRARVGAYAARCRALVPARNSPDPGRDRPAPGWRRPGRRRGAVLPGA
ncbi:MAG: hypothetical protein WDN69_37915 [Aliidongia sp.]